MNVLPVALVNGQWTNGHARQRSTPPAKFTGSNAPGRPGQSSPKLPATLPVAGCPPVVRRSTLPVNRRPVARLSLFEERPATLDTPRHASRHAPGRPRIDTPGTTPRLASLPSIRHASRLASRLTLLRPVERDSPDFQPLTPIYINGGPPTKVRS